MENYLRLFWHSSKEVYQRCLGIGTRDRNPARGRCLAIPRRGREFSWLPTPLQPHRSCPLRTPPPLAPAPSCFPLHPFVVPHIGLALANPTSPALDLSLPTLLVTVMQSQLLCRWLSQARGRFGKKLRPSKFPSSVRALVGFTGMQIEPSQRRLQLNSIDTVRNVNGL